VANWNDARSIQKDQRAMLEQLYTDLAPRMEGWREINEVYSVETDADKRFVLDALRAGTLGEADKARFDAGLVTIVQWQLIDVSLLQRRMESTELFSEFQGTAYKDILVALHRNWAVSEAFDNQYENRGHNARNIVFSRVFMQPGPYNAPESAELTPFYVFDELVQDKEFLHAIAQLYHYGNSTRSRVYQAYLSVADSVSRLESALYPNGNVPE